MLQTSDNMSKLRFYMFFFLKKEAKKEKCLLKQKYHSLRGMPPTAHSIHMNFTPLVSSSGI